MHAPVVLVADYAGTIEFSDLSEIRGRTTQAQGQPTVFGVDASTQPQLRARLTEHHGWEYTAAYLPLLTLPDLQAGIQAQLFHTGDARITWHDRRVSVSVNEDVTYGTFNTAFLTQPAAQPAQPMAGAAPAVGGATPPPVGGTTPPPVQLAPPPGTLTTLSTHTAATVLVQVDRRASFSLGASYTAAGGFDAPSRLTLPEQYGPRADASFAYVLSRRDRALTLAYAQRRDFTVFPCFLTPQVPCAPQDEIAQVSEGIEHAIQRATTVTVAAGASAARSRQTHDVPYQASWYPVAEGALTHRFGERGDMLLSLGVQLAPLIDPRTGLVNNRLQGQATLTDTVSALMTLRALATGSQTIPTNAPLAASLVGGGAEVVLHVSRELVLALGLRGLRQEQSPFGAFFSTIGYLDVTVHAPALPF